MTTTQKPEILNESHYYPFGMEQDNPRYAKRDEKYKYKYQEQERQDELNLNWDSFKWRNYDYALGRFMSVDPLAEEYSYQSPYNFSENRVIDGVELEGLEWGNFQEANIGATINRSEKIIGRPLLGKKQKLQ